MHRAPLFQAIPHVIQAAANVNYMGPLPESAPQSHEPTKPYKALNPKTLTPKPQNLNP